MKRCNLIWIVVVSLIIGLFVIPAFSQEKNAAGGTTQETTPVVKEEAPQAKELAIYGEVQDVKAASSSISVQYYDYDSDEEKTVDIPTDKNTKLENATGVSDIKKGDWVDVTYEVIGGKNIAKFIMVEKEEEASGARAPESAPAELPEEE